MLKKSNYNFYSKFNNNDVFLYNTKTGAAVALEEMDDISIRWILDDQVQFVNDKIDKNLIYFLEENKYIIDENENELDEIKDLYYSYVNDNEVLSLTLLPTEGCNFACPYCFLYKKNNNHMTSEDYEATIKLILKFSNIETKKKKKLIINWFGGEPTLKINEIVTFTDKIMPILKSKDMLYFSTITTNGYLLTIENFKKLLKSGITDFQVTIDGDKENHDINRYLINHAGTYDIIINNLRNICEYETDIKYRFKIRCNFTKKSLGSMYRFLEYYKCNFSANKNFSIYFRPVYNYDTLDNDIESMKNEIYSLEEGIIEQNKLNVQVSNLMGQPIDRRMISPLPEPTFAWCNAEMTNHYIIGPNGKIYICDTLVGQNAIGNLNNNGDVEFESKDSYNINYDIFKDDRTKKCLSCKMLPICFGGCKRNRLSGEAQCYWSKYTIYEAMKNNYLMQKSIIN